MTKFWDKTGWKLISILAIVGHLVWVVVFGFGWWQARTQSAAASDWLKKVCPACTHPSDAVSIAYSLGRLDLIAVSLAVLAAVLTVAAFLGFWLVRSSAIQAANECASEAHLKAVPTLAESAKETAAQAAAQYLADNFSKIVSSSDLIDRILADSRLYITLTAQMERRSDQGDGVANPSDADDMAAAFGEGENGQF